MSKLKSLIGIIKPGESPRAMNDNYSPANFKRNVTCKNWPVWWSISMKTFLTYTAIVELVTGVVLIFLLTFTVRFLPGTELSGNLAILLTMIAGTAIFTTGWTVWIVRLIARPVMEIKMLVIYNAAICLVLLFGKLKLERQRKERNLEKIRDIVSMNFKGHRKLF